MERPRTDADDARRREVDEELDRTTGPTDDGGVGLTDATELSPDRDEAMVNPVADEDTDAPLARDEH